MRIKKRCKVRSRRINEGDYMKRGKRQRKIK
jgi:hypothetical protein